MIGEEAAGQPSSAARDDHAPRLSQGLEANAKVRRLTDDRLLPGRARSDEVAKHHEAGRDRWGGGCWGRCKS
jgi:hypothetical protein